MKKKKATSSYNPGQLLSKRQPLEQVVHPEHRQNILQVYA